MKWFPLTLRCAQTRAGLQDSLRFTLLTFSFEFMVLDSKVTDYAYLPEEHRLLL